MYRTPDWLVIYYQYRTPSVLTGVLTLHILN